jgi:hypothetical protein
MRLMHPPHLLLRVNPMNTSAFRRRTTDFDVPFTVTKLIRHANHRIIRLKLKHPVAERALDNLAHPPSSGLRNKTGSDCFHSSNRQLTFIPIRYTFLLVQQPPYLPFHFGHLAVAIIVTVTWMRVVDAALGGVPGQHFDYCRQDAYQ